METRALTVVRAKVTDRQHCGEGSREERPGTKHFRPGSKVYVIDAHWGRCDAVTVVGHHRASGRYAKLDMSVKHLEDFRLDRTYSPKVIALTEEHFSDRREYSEPYAKELLNVLPLWKAESL